MDIEETITIPEAARLKGVRRQSIYTAIKAGKIRVASEMGGWKLLVKADVESYKPYKSAGPRTPPTASSSSAARESERGEQETT